MHEIQDGRRRTKLIEKAKKREKECVCVSFSRSATLNLTILRVINIFDCKTIKVSIYTYLMTTETKHYNITLNMYNDLEICFCACGQCVWKRNLYMLQNFSIICQKKATKLAYLGDTIIASIHITVSAEWLSTDHSNWRYGRPYYSYFSCLLLYINQ